MFTSSIKREIRHFHFVVVQKRERNVQKKCDARVKLLFCLIKPIVFMDFLVAVASLNFKVPILSDDGHRLFFFSALYIVVRGKQ